ncbi:MAG: SUMF1/EgtB/PvdO family nonheme iron enzyme, partial [Acidobacteriota bacterium]
MQTPPGLDQLLSALQAEGIPAGPGEVTRLQQAFALAPRLDEASLRHLLQCTLVKKADHQEVFRSLYDEWVEAAQNWLQPQPGTELPTGRPGRVEEKKKASTLPLQTMLVAILAAALLISLAIQWVPVQRIQPTWQATEFFSCPVKLPIAVPFNPDAATRVGAGDTARPSGRFEPAQSFKTWIPSITVTPPDTLQAVSRLLGLGFFGLAPWLAGAALVWRYRRLIRLPASAPPMRREGPRWLPFLSADQPAQLLGDEQKRSLIWGIGHFVSEEPTGRIDLPATVKATARAAGLPTIHYQMAQYPREVWLWCDLMADDPSLLELAAEIRTSLEKAGLPVRTGVFHGLPDSVCWEEGEEFSPLILEGHRQNAIVCILSDGEGMRLADRASHRRGPLRQLLSALAEWPRLVLVDFGAGGRSLPRLAGRFAIPVIEPVGLPAYLGAQQTAATGTRQSVPGLSGDLRIWAAALALSPDPVPDSAAQQIRQHLGLNADPLDLRRIHQDPGAVMRGRSLDWRPSRRAQLLGWLLAVDGPPSGRNWPAGSAYLAPSLRFWLVQCSSRRKEQESREEQQGQLHPWQDSEAEQRHQLREALLELWLDPDRAAEKLYRLFRGELKDAVEQELRNLTPGGWPEEKPSDSASDRILLPWQWQERSPRTRQMLWEMGLGGRPETAPAALRMSGNLALGLGLCLGLGAVALIAAGSRMATAPEPVLHFQDPFYEKYTLHEAIPSGLGSYRIVAGTARHPVLLPESIAGGSTVTLAYRWEEQPSVQGLGKSELWRSGRLPQRLRASEEEEWPRRSFAVIEADSEDDPARQLAAELLDRASADRVLIGLDWAEHLVELLQPGQLGSAADQLLLIRTQAGQLPAAISSFQGRFSQVVANDLKELTTLLEFATQADSSGRIAKRIRPAGQVWSGPSVRVMPPLEAGWLGSVRKWLALGNPRQDAAEALLRAGPAEWTESGITFIQVAGGIFTMGTLPESLSQKSIQIYGDEQPAHPVRVSSFWLSKHEITNLQYRRHVPGHAPKEHEDWPVSRVSWGEAREFCQSLDHRLPTEAQWEYAVRAGSTSAWHFGDDPQELKDYAWFGANSEGRPHPFGQLAPNPLGLYDMYGNLWE